MNQAIQYKIGKYLNKIKMAETNVKKNIYQKKLNKYIQQGGDIHLPRIEMKQQSANYYGGNLKQDMEKIKIHLTNMNIKKNVNDTNKSIKEKINKINNTDEAINVGERIVDTRGKNIESTKERNDAQNNFMLLTSKTDKYDKYYQNAVDKMPGIVKQIDELRNEYNKKITMLDGKYGGFATILIALKPSIIGDFDDDIKKNIKLLSIELQKIRDNYNTYYTTNIAPVISLVQNQFSKI